jgi:hypothetical protein
MSASRGTSTLERVSRRSVDVDPGLVTARLESPLPVQRLGGAFSTHTSIAIVVRPNG